MGFLLEITDMDLGDTPIENIFINDFMPMANGTYVKVYLLGYKYAYDRDENIELDNKTIAKHLEISLEDVHNAWSFWEKKGIIEKVNINLENPYDYEVKFLNLKQLYIKNNSFIIKGERSKEGPKTKGVTSKDLLEANEIPSINNMFNSIDDIMKRQMVPIEKMKILSWITDYNMNPDVIEKAFSYSIDKGKRNLNYIEGIVRNWYDEGLTNMESIIEYFKSKDERYYSYQRIMKALGFHIRPMTEIERKIMDKWLDDYRMPLDLILRACDTAARTSNPSINYINGTIESWYKKGIKTVEDIDILDVKPERKVANKNYTNYNRPKATKTKFHNFDQRSDKYSEKELEDIARRKREAYIRELKGE